MILDELRKQTLQTLLTYRDALESLSQIYEQRLLPYYGMATEFDRRTQHQIDANARLGEIKERLSEVYKAIEYVVFSEMDSLGKEKADKSLLTESKVTRKTKRNAKKTDKKN